MDEATHRQIHEPFANEVFKQLREIERGLRQEISNGLEKLRNELKSDIQNIETPISTYAQLEEKNRNKLGEMHKLVDGIIEERAQRRIREDEFMEQLACRQKDHETATARLIQDAKPRWYQSLGHGVVQALPLAVIITVVLFAANAAISSYKDSMTTATASFKEQLNETKKSVENLQLEIRQYQQQQRGGNHGLAAQGR